METTDNIKFIKASANDILLLSQMIKKLYEKENTAFIEADVNNALGRLIHNESFGTALLIYVDDVLAGYMIIAAVFSIEFKGEASFLDELYIEEEFRGKGIGLKAVEYAEKFALNKGHKALRLEVEYQNLAAQNLYRKKGFTAHERHLMTKWLEANKENEKF